MTQQDKFEYKLEIGARSTETHALYLTNWSVSMARNQVPIMDIVVSRTADSLAITTNDAVSFFRRTVGEVTWGAAVFRGFIKKRNPKGRANEVALTAYGYLEKANGRGLHSYAWGNTHIVDQEYPVTYSSSAAGHLLRCYVDLDAAQPAQVPLETVKILRLSQYVNGGDTLHWTQAVYNIAAGNYKQCAQAFSGRGLLRKIWVYAYRMNNNAVDLTVAIQGDAAGVPNGTDITTFVVPKALFGIGVGNASWVEIDLLRNVTDPTLLDLVTGQTYWAVFRMDNLDATQSYQFYFGTSIVMPAATFSVFSITAPWAPQAGNKGFFLAMDHETCWVEIEPEDYQVNGESTPPRVWFVKWDTTMADTPSQGSFKGYDFPVLFTGQKLARISYWKGTITYATVLQQWAQAYLSDLYDTLDISITEPTTKQYCVQVENADAMAAFMIIRQYASLCVRMYLDATGNDVLEVRDEKAPDTATWNLYTATEKAKRTFMYGLDSTSDDQIRILDDDLVEELLRETNTISITDNTGRVMGVTGAGPLVSGSMGIMGGSGGRLTAGVAIADAVYGKFKVVRKSGSVRLGGIDQSVADGPFRDPNQLCYIKDTRLGFDGIYAVQALKWGGGTGKVTGIGLTFADSVISTFLPGTFDPLDTPPSGASNAPMRPGSKFITKIKELFRPSDGRYRGMVTGQGATDAPLTTRSSRGTARAMETIYNKDLTVIWNPAMTYWIKLGTGVPAPPNLGVLQAQVMGMPQPTADGVVLAAWFSWADFGLTSAWPMEISEVGLATSSGATGAKTAIWAKSLGVPSGTFNIFNPRPQMGRHKQVAVFIMIANP